MPGVRQCFCSASATGSTVNASLMSMTTSSVDQVGSFFSERVSFSLIAFIILVASTGLGRISFSGKVLLLFPPLLRRSIMTLRLTSPVSFTFTMRPSLLTVPPFGPFNIFFPVQLLEEMQTLVSVDLHLRIRYGFLKADIVLDVLLQSSIRVPSTHIDFLLFVHAREDLTRFDGQSKGAPFTNHFGTAVSGSPERLTHFSSNSASVSCTRPSPWAPHSVLLWAPRSLSVLSSTPWPTSHWLCILWCHRTPRSPRRSGASPRMFPMPSKSFDPSFEARVIPELPCAGHASHPRKPMPVAFLLSSAPLSSRRTFLFLLSKPSQMYSKNLTSQLAAATWYSSDSWMTFVLSSMASVSSSNLACFTRSFEMLPSTTFALPSKNSDLAILMKCFAVRRPYSAHRALGYSADFLDFSLPMIGSCGLSPNGYPLRKVCSPGRVTPINWGLRCLAPNSKSSSNPQVLKNADCHSGMSSSNLTNSGICHADICSSWWLGGGFSSVAKLGTLTFLSASVIALTMFADLAINKVPWSHSFFLASCRCCLGSLHGSRVYVPASHTPDATGKVLWLPSQCLLTLYALWSPTSHTPPPLPLRGCQSCRRSDERRGMFFLGQILRKLQSLPHSGFSLASDRHHLVGLLQHVASS